MIKAVVTINGNPTDVVPSSARRLGQLVAKYVSAELRPQLKRDVKAELRGKEPGKPKYPLRWMNDAQRRAVMAKLRRAGNLPYRRTHALSNGWESIAKTDPASGYLEIFHPWDKAGFVVGVDQQPFHQDTGWYQTSGDRGVFARMRERYEDRLMDEWPELLAESIK